MAETTEKRDRVLGFVKENGPVLPIQISKEINVDTMFSGAMLSQLVNEGKLIVTKHLRVGGSPVYYIEGQESKLESYLKHLNEKDITSINFLKEKGVIADESCSPLQRVSFRIVKDFAKSIILRKDSGEKEVFWRYFLVNEDAAKEKILEMVSTKKKKDKQKTVEEFKDEEAFERKPSPKEPLSEKDFHEKKEEEKSLMQEEQGVISSKPLQRVELKDIVKEFFRVNNMTLWEEKVIRRRKDINYIVSFDTRVGNLKYFVKFRDKKRINEGDISLAFNDAGNLPLIFLSKGDLTGTAKKLIDEKLQGVVFKKLR